jgi:hypothetical protein
MKNPNDAIGNRTRDLPACSAAPQPTAPPRAPLLWIMSEDILYLSVVSPDVKMELLTTSEMSTIQSVIYKVQQSIKTTDSGMKLYGLFIVFTYNAREEVLTAVVSRCATNEIFCHFTLCSNSLQNVVEWLWGNYCTVKAIIYTEAYKNLSPYIQHSSSGLSKFRCKRSEQNGIWRATVQRTSVQGRLHVSDGRKRDYL